MGKGGNSLTGLLCGTAVGCICIGAILLIVGTTRLFPSSVAPDGVFIEHDGGCVITAATLVESGRSSTVRAGENECVDLYIFDVKFVGSNPSMDLDLDPFESREWSTPSKCGSPTPVPVPPEYRDGSSHQCWYPTNELTHQQTISYKCSTNYLNKNCKKLFNPAEDYSPPSTGWLFYMIGGGFCVCFCGCPLLFFCWAGMESENKSSTPPN